MSTAIDVSVVIPTYNGRDKLLETLEALAKTDYRAGTWETIVVDDGSTDATADMVRDWCQTVPIPVTFLEQANAGPASARNRGAASAKGHYLIFIDNDIVVQPDFVRRHVETLIAYPGCWIVGRSTMPPEICQTPFGRYRYALWDSFHDAVDTISETMGMTGNNVSLPRSDFIALKGFDERFSIASCEDSELGMRARKQGIKILYQPDIVALHNDWGATSLESLCERQRLYSISDVLLWHM
ncbi:MAG: hypothetical protein ETSY1_33590 [Candidatus Entotheonella factor]|nr:MAG: hypothetical protein ETSY1_33590 [Candidatus Entotheonella factor]